MADLWTKKPPKEVRPILIAFGMINLSSALSSILEVFCINDFMFFVKNSLFDTILTIKTEINCPITIESKSKSNKIKIPAINK